MVRQEGKAAAPSSVVDEEWMESVPVERRTTGAELCGGGPFGSGLELLSKLPQA